MTRFPASGGGSGPPYTYVMDGYPSDAEEGESLYHVTEDAAYVYTGSSWVEQTVTNHGQLAGISEGDHRSDQRVADLAPVQSRYTDNEARTAVDGSSVSVGNADQLANQSPSYYETPNSTNSGGELTQSGQIARAGEDSDFSVRVGAFVERIEGQGGGTCTFRTLNNGNYDLSGGSYEFFSTPVFLVSINLTTGFSNTAQAYMTAVATQNHSHGL